MNISPAIRIYSRLRLYERSILAYTIRGMRKNSIFALGMRRNGNSKVRFTAVALCLLAALLPYFFQTSTHVHITSGTQEETPLTTSHSGDCLLCHFGTASAIDVAPVALPSVTESVTELAGPAVLFCTAAWQTVLSLRAPPIL